jgi:hypothetical protein
LIPSEQTAKALTYLVDILLAISLLPAAEETANQEFYDFFMPFVML